MRKISMALMILLAGSVGLMGQPQSLDQLISKLGSDRFKEREEASRLLDALGPDALDALRAAGQNPDTEVRRRAQALVEKIEKRLENAFFLTPQRLRLVCADTPLPKVVQDLAQLSGYSIRLENSANLADQKITIDTGEVPFWEALHQLCSLAGLRELEPPQENKKPNQGGGNSIVIMGGGVGPIASKDILKAPVEKQKEIILASGTLSPLPHQVAGSVRLRALPPGTTIPAHTAVPGEWLIALEASAEPKWNWRQIVALEISRALDDRGQLLDFQRISFQAVKPPAPNNNRGGVIIINGQVIEPNAPKTQEFSRLIPVRLKTGEQPARALKELTGTVTAWMETPPLTLVTIENILQASGKTFQGKRTGTVHVMDAKRLEDGVIRLRLEVDAPQRELVEKPPINLGGQVVIINGQVVSGPKKASLSGANFSLVDAQGKPFQLIMATDTGKGSGRSSQVELLFRPGPGQNQPARFHYTDRRCAVVEVPFGLKDVPLAGN